MAVFLTKDKKELIVTCSCGCEDSFHIILDDEVGKDDHIALLTYMKGKFSADSSYSFWQVLKIKLQRIWKILRNKDYYYAETLMTREDFQIFKEYINRF